MRTPIHADETNESGQPRPGDILLRLCALLAVALCFGFVAQLLVGGVPH